MFPAISIFPAWKKNGRADDGAITFHRAQQNHIHSYFSLAYAVPNAVRHGNQSVMLWDETHPILIVIYNVLSQTACKHPLRPIASPMTLFG